MLRLFYRYNIFRREKCKKTWEFVYIQLQTISTVSRLEVLNNTHNLTRLRHLDSERYIATVEEYVEDILEMCRYM